MAMTEQTRTYFDAHFAPETEQLWANDKEFAERFAEFALNEVVSQNQLDEKTRFLAILATLLGCQGVDAFRVMLPAALKAGVTPVEAKEVVYQATAYLGMGRVFPFLQATNDVLTGEGMQDFWRSGPEESRHINRWLAANCFGDYYTRTGLDTR